VVTSRGPAFKVIELDGTLVWSLEFPGDYDDVSHSLSPTDLFDYLDRRPPIAAVNSRSFDIRRARRKERIRFGIVEKDDGVWQAAETVRTPER